LKEGSRTKLVTPQASGSLLKGVTRDSLFTLAQDLGYEVEERPITTEEWRDGSRTGVITETFACGTAAVIVPVGRVRSADAEDFLINEGQPGPVTTRLRELLLGIQHGTVLDKHGWRVLV
jgi:branched-chain amino acid aminotransferase